MYFGNKRRLEACVFDQSRRFYLFTIQANLLGNVKPLPDVSLELFDKPRGQLQQNSAFVSLPYPALLAPTPPNASIFLGGQRAELGGLKENFLGQPPSTFSLTSANGRKEEAGRLSSRVRSSTPLHVSVPIHHSVTTIGPSPPLRYNYRSQSSTPLQVSVPVQHSVTSIGPSPPLRYKYRSQSTTPLQVSVPVHHSVTSIGPSPPLRYKYRVSGTNIFAGTRERSYYIIGPVLLPSLRDSLTRFSGGEKKVDVKTKDRGLISTVQLEEQGVFTAARQPQPTTLSANTRAVPLGMARRDNTSWGLLHLAAAWEM
ncbi:unnamed protein product [Cyprideis torosa]|uniref:Uncharacterized protein n=1 Tax=Cyprideis torosa TaxID=163714 RepID=A0A7R8W1G7_9CRUS|nr:unnamed protein product [Cyprideis torosa]CAG0880888.1 unnamed protein product [Cyprideis torosa]